MNNSKVVKIFLVVGGLIGLYVGVNLVFFPVELQEQVNIIIGDNPSHLSETRAPGTAILAASLFMFLGVFRQRWTETALILSALFYLSYGLGRMFSLAVDGMPAEGLFAAMIGELVLGVFAFILLRKFQTA